MKKVKSVLDMLLIIAAVMVFAVPTMASASAGAASITVKPNDQVAHKFTAYQIFAGDLSADGVLSNVVWADSVKGSRLINELQTDETVGEFFMECTDAAEVAEVLAGTDINAGDMPAIARIFSDNKTLLATGIELTERTAEGYYKTSNVPVGYYLITDEITEGTGKASDLILCVTTDALIDVKVQDAPVVTKEAYGISYGIGDSIPYTVTVRLGDYPANASEYEFTLVDQFGDNLEPDFAASADPSSIPEGVKVYLGDENHDITEYFSLSYNKEINTMTLTANQEGKNNLVGMNGLMLSKKSEIIVKYRATIVDLDDSAAGVVNKATYNTSAIVPEYVYPVNIAVHTVDSMDKATPLGGAEFVLYKCGTGDTEKYYAVVSPSNRVVNWTTDIENASVLTTSTDGGTFTVYGLSADAVYYLKETKAPAGYNLPASEDSFQLTIRVEENIQHNGLKTLQSALNKGSFENGNLDTRTVTVTISNGKGAQLPSTGGTGTTVFYVIGGILAVGAIVLLVTRKRMGRE